MLSGNLGWYQRTDEIDNSATFTIQCHANWGFSFDHLQTRKGTTWQVRKSLQSDRIARQ